MDHACIGLLLCLALSHLTQSDLHVCWLAARDDTTARRQRPTAARGGLSNRRAAPAPTASSPLQRALRLHAAYCHMQQQQQRQRPAGRKAHAGLSAAHASACSCANGDCLSLSSANRCIAPRGPSWCAIAEGIPALRPDSAIKLLVAAVEVGRGSCSTGPLAEQAMRVFEMPFLAL